MSRLSGGRKEGFISRLLWPAIVYSRELPRKLTNILTAVPNDIEIAQAATPVPIQQIAANVGIFPDELELHGTTKPRSIPPSATG
jgi:hypothetical protein